MPRAGWKQNRLLELIAKHSSVSHPLVTSTIAMAGDQWHWGEVHSQFRHVLRETLKLDEIKTKSVEEEELVYVLALTEQVAKVIYNATNPDDEFDEDSAAWIVAMFRGFVATSETRTSR